MTVRFSASAADRLMACHGSANLDLAIPGWQEPVRDDTAGNKGIGTNVHAVFAELVKWGNEEMAAFAEAVMDFQALHYTKRNKVLENDATVEAYLIGRIGSVLRYVMVEAIEQFKVTATFTPKMMRFICSALGEVQTLFAAAYTDWASERKYTVYWLQTRPTTTPDLWFYDALSGHLVVVDFKTGVIPVEANENQQLMYYAATVMHEEGFDVKTITLQIIQPGHPSEVTMNRAELEHWMAEARVAEQRILDKDLTLKPTDKGCKFCPANPHSRGDKGTPLCPAMMDVLYPQVIDEEIYSGL